MKVIVRRVPARTVRSYQCEVCGTKHAHESQAKNCEARSNNDIRFYKLRVGDTVEIKLPHFCDHGKLSKSFTPSGCIIKRIGPVVSDADYERRWGEDPDRVHGHVFQYEVTFKCCCGKGRSGLFYNPELSLIKRRKRIKSSR